MAFGGHGDKHESAPGGIQWNRASPYAREMAKWEMDSHEFGPPGRPRGSHGGAQPYPAMFYKVKRSTTGGRVEVTEQQTAESEADARNLLSRGFYNGLAEAAEALAETEQTAAVLSANRNFNDRNMSDKAKAESQAAEDAHDGHLAMVPETPVLKRQIKS